MASAAIEGISLMRMFVDVEQIYLHRDAVDFRKSIMGLAAIVELSMQLSPLSGALFVFCNQNRTRLKVLYWDKTGFCLWYKRLEKDKFAWPKKSEFAVLTLTPQQWEWLLSGVDISLIKTHKSMVFKDESLF